MENIFAKGGKTKVKYDYIPQKAIDELSYTIDKVTKGISGDKLLSGVYVKSDAKSKTKSGSNLTAKILAMTDDEDKKEVILEKDVKEFQKYISDKLITAFYLGLPLAYDFKGDYSYGGGVITMVVDDAKRKTTQAIKNAKNKKFELGLKYPQYDFEKLLGKPIIKDVFGKTMTFNDGTTEKYKYRLWIWKDCVIGQTLGSENSSRGFNDYTYGKKPTLMGGYKSVQTSKESKLESIINFMAKDKDGFVKDNNVLYNGLGGANFETLETNKIKFSKGGRIVGEYYFDTRFDKPFRVVYVDGNKMGIEYIDKKNKKTDSKTINKSEFDYNVKMGAWNKYTQPFTYAKGGVVSDKRQRVAELLVQMDYDNGFYDEELDREYGTTTVDEAIQWELENRVKTDKDADEYIEQYDFEQYDYAKGGFIEGDIVRITDYSNENYDKYLDKQLVIKSISEDSDGDLIFDLSDKNSGEELPFILLENEIETFAKGGKTKRSKHSIMQDRRRISSEPWEVAYQKRKSKMEKGGDVYDFRPSKEMIEKEIKQLQMHRPNALTDLERFRIDKKIRQNKEILKHRKSKMEAGGTLPTPFGQAGLVGETGAMNEMELFAMGGGLPQGVHQYYANTYNPAYPTPHGYAKGGSIMSNRDAMEDFINSFSKAESDKIEKSAQYYSVTPITVLSTLRKYYKVNRFDDGSVKQIRIDLFDEPSETQFKFSKKYSKGEKFAKGGEIKMEEGNKIYALAESLTELEKDKLLLTLNEKETEKFNTLIQLGDSVNLALISTLVEESPQYRLNWLKRQKKSSVSNLSMAKGGEIEDEMQYGSWYVEIEEDENDEEIRNQEVSRLIREGYLSGFYPTWSLEITDIDGDIDEATENEIARLVEEGYTSGEVVMYKYAKGGDLDSRYSYDIEYVDSEGDEYNEGFDSLEDAKKEIKYLKENGYRITRKFRYLDDKYVGSFAKGGKLDLDVYYSKMVDKLGKEATFIRILKDSQFDKARIENEYRYSRNGKYMTASVSDEQVVFYGMVNETFTSPKKLAEYLDKNQIFAKGGMTDVERQSMIDMGYTQEQIKESENNPRRGGRFAKGGEIVVKGIDKNGGEFYREFDSYENALEEISQPHFNHLDRDSIRYYDENDDMIFAKGGKIGFDGLAKKVAKRYEGKPVKEKFQSEYGKTYSKAEAMEVGKKVAGKVYRQQQSMAKGGEIQMSEVYNVNGKDYLFSTPIQNAKGTYTGWDAYEVVYDTFDGEKHLNYTKTKKGKSKYFPNGVKRTEAEDYFAKGGEIQEKRERIAEYIATHEDLDNYGEIDEDWYDWEFDKKLKWVNKNILTDDKEVKYFFDEYLYAKGGEVVGLSISRLHSDFPKGFENSGEVIKKGNSKWKVENGILLRKVGSGDWKEWRKITYAKGGKTQGYNDKLDESLGNTKGKRSTKEQNYKDRRNESEAMEKKGGKRKYASVKTMDKGSRSKRKTPLTLAKEIRKEGEKWQDAVKRASAILKKKAK